jgi:hypothetical protein
MRTSTDAPCILNPGAYAGILDAIIEHADHKTRVALWGTCRALYEHVSAHLFRHVAQGLHFRSADGHALPTKFATPLAQAMETGHALWRYARVFDLTTPLETRDLGAVVPFLRNLRTIRMPTSLDLDAIRVRSPNVPIFRSPQLVLRTASIPRVLLQWSCAAIFVQHRLPPAERVVLNVAYTWPQQLFSARLAQGLLTLGKDTTELVIHFKKVGKRPRYLLCRHDAVPPESLGLQGATEAYLIRIVEQFTSASPPPTLGPGQYLELIRALGPAPSLFEQIAQMYAHATKDRELKLTLVGVDAFDAARDADAADDEAFARVAPSLPWGRPPPPPELYQHPAYRPVAPTLIDRIAELVDPPKRSSVRRNVTLLSSAAYLAGLEHPDDEDWWEPEEEQCSCCHNGKSYTLAAVH